jgi:hypothetical protein
MEHDSTVINDEHGKPLFEIKRLGKYIIENHDIKKLEAILSPSRYDTMQGLNILVLEGYALDDAPLMTTYTLVKGEGMDAEVIDSINDESSSINEACIQLLKQRNDIEFDIPVLIA